MTAWEIASYVFCGGIIVIGGIALLIYWALFMKDYYTSLAKYKELLNTADIEDVDNIYNREFPADFSVKEIQEWVKGDKDDTEAS